jgi:5-methyltetrahydrofolate--homocysteine methyltransferase
MNEPSRKKPPADALLKQFYDLVIAGDNESLKKLVRSSLAQGISATEILYQGMLPAMDQIGDEFKLNNIFIPEVLLSARAMNEGLVLLEPHLIKQETDQHCKVLIGTIHGDMHDIGKNLVAIMLKGAGFQVIDLGLNVPVETFLEQASNHRPDLVCLSSLLTTAMPGMKTVIDKLAEHGLKATTKVMVGGAPVNQRFADNIGADGYADDAVRAVDVAKKLVRISP